MTDALEDHEGTVSIGGRALTNLRFANDIDGLAGDEEALAKLVELLDKAFTAYGMEISVEKSLLVSLYFEPSQPQRITSGLCREDQADDNTSGINTEIKVNGQKLETVASFKNLGCYN